MLQICPIDCLLFDSNLFIYVVIVALYVLYIQNDPFRYFQFFINHISNSAKIIFFFRDDSIFINKANREFKKKINFNLARR